MLAVDEPGVVHMPLIHKDDHKKAFARLQRKIKTRSGCERSEMVQDQGQAKYA